MGLVITTWNAQGAVFSDAAKKNVLQDLYETFFGQPHIFMIQEAGSGENDRPVFYHGRDREQYFASWTAAQDAQNERCTVGIVAPSTVYGKLDILYTAYSRPVKTFTLHTEGLDFLRVCCIHAIANQPKARDEITEVTRKLNLGSLPWILAGDMNCTPANLGFYSGLRYSSGVATQRSGNELDYFFASAGVQVTGGPVVRRYAPSDHDPVTIQID